MSIYIFIIWNNNNNNNNQNDNSIIMIVMYVEIHKCNNIIIYRNVIIYVLQI